MFLFFAGINASFFPILPDRWTDKSCKCQQFCVEKFAGFDLLKSKVQAFQEKCDGLGIADRKNLFFDLLKQMSVNHETGIHGPIRQYVFLGFPVCFNAFLILTKTSKNYLRGIMHAIEGGAKTAPSDGRSERHAREKPAVQSANTFFQWAYDHLAEPLAEGVMPDTAEDKDDEAIFQAQDDFFAWILGVGHSAGAPDFQEDKPQKWLPHMKVADLYQQYLFQVESISSEQGPPCSQSVFYKVWKDWQGILKIRRQNQHAKCDDCVRYNLHRSRASSESEKQAIQASYNEHIRGVWADRFVCHNYATQSALSTAPDSTIPFKDRTLFLALDGMDQARCWLGIMSSLKPKSMSNQWLNQRASSWASNLQKGRFRFFDVIY